MKQVLIVHGGHSFASYDAYITYLQTSEIEYERLKPQKAWKSWIAEQMPNADVLLPTFPNGSNASYEEWSMYFEKLIPFFGDDTQIVGHSLGAMFLTKYLNDHTLAKPIKRLVLVAGGWDDETAEDLGSFKVTSAKNVALNTKEVHLFHSKDDDVVPFTELMKYQAAIPTATSHIFEDRGHSFGETLPELLTILQQS